MKAKHYALSTVAVSRFLTDKNLSRATSYASQIRGARCQQAGFQVGFAREDADALVLSWVQGWTSIVDASKVAPLRCHAYAEALRERYDVEVIENGSESHVLVREKAVLVDGVPTHRSVPMKATAANVRRVVYARGFVKAEIINLRDRKYRYTAGVEISGYGRDVCVQYRDGLPGVRRFPEQTEKLRALLAERFEVSGPIAESDRLVVSTKGKTEKV